MRMHTRVRHAPVVTTLTGALFRTVRTPAGAGTPGAVSRLVGTPWD